MMTGFLNARNGENDEKNEKKENNWSRASLEPTPPKKKYFKRIKNITSFVYHDDGRKNLIHFYLSPSWCLSFLMCFLSLPQFPKCVYESPCARRSQLDGSSERKRINSISLYTKSSNTKSIIFPVISLNFKKGPMG